MSAIGKVRAAAVAAVVGFSAVASAGPTNGFVDPQALSLMPGAGSSSAQAFDNDLARTSGVDLPSEGESRPLMMDAAAAEAPNIHGFIEVPFKTAYVTPRGLVVENAGLVIQPVAGFVFPIGDFGAVKNVTFVTGVWNSINTNQGDHSVGAWNELDYFASLSGVVGKFSGTFTYSPWYSPPHNFQIEHTADFKLTYDDTGLIAPDFAIKPYMDFFWSIAGDSTVILGRRGSTWYVELGITPSYTYKGIQNYPLTFTFPTYFSVGPSHFWNAAGDGGNFGVASTSVNVSMPLAFIPARYGFWHADAGVQYFYLLNGTLVDAGTLASGNDNRNVVNASVGFGVNF